MRNPLLLALETNDIDGFQDALNNDADPNEVDENNKPILILACEAKSSEFALALLKRPDIKLNVDFSGKTPLMCAAESDHKAVVEMLLESPLTNIHAKYQGKTALAFAKPDSACWKLIQQKILGPGTQESAAMMDEIPQELWTGIIKFLDNKSIAALRLVAVSLAAKSVPGFLAALGLPKLVINGPGVASLWRGKAYYWGAHWAARGQIFSLPQVLSLPAKERVTQIFLGTHSKLFTFLSQKGQLYSIEGEKFPLPEGKKVVQFIEILAEGSWVSGNAIDQYQYPRGFLLTDKGKLYESKAYGDTFSKYYNRKELGMPKDELLRKLFVFQPNAGMRVDYHFHCFSQSQSGKSYTYGLNQYGQLAQVHRDSFKPGEQLKLPEGEEIDDMFFEVHRENNEIMHFIACITQQGNLYVWGGVAESSPAANDYVQHMPIPQPIPLLGEKAKQLIRCSTHLFCLTHSGRVLRVAHVANRKLFVGIDVLKLGDNEKVVQVSSHGDYLICRTEKGRLYSVDTTDCTLPCVQIPFPDGVVIVQFFSVRKDSNDIRTTISQDIFLALSDKGDLYAWGTNVNGELALGHNDPVIQPQKVPVPAGRKLTQFWLIGQRSILCLAQDGILFSAGANDKFQLGLGNNQAQNFLNPVPVPEQVHRIFSADCSVYCVTRSGRLYSWGRSDNTKADPGYQLGRAGDKSMPTRIEIYDGLINMRESLAARLQLFQNLKEESSEDEESSESSVLQ